MKKKLGAGLLVLVLAFLYYYVTLPAINIHESGFWFFLAAVVAVILLLYAVKKRIRSVYEFKSNKVLKGGVFVILAIGVVYAVGALLSSPIVNANKYQKLVEPEERNFTEDIKEISYDQIPLLDKESASLLGDRKMGSMVDLVSQFEVSSLYSQINYKGQPYRVTPLEYASAIKWLTNQKEGIPAYILIDMATQNTELVQLDEGIKYSESEYFNRNIYRHLRFKYPTYMFDQLSFEIDDEGTPYWICPVKKFNIGLFGGQTIGRVVLCNAQTGETKDYKIEDCPQWVDRAYPAELLTQLYNYHGMLKNGFFNSVLGQKGCLQTTDGFNYLALEDDVWVYTGVTSVSGDKSNLGFVLMNQRTMETRYYACDGAQERVAECEKNYEKLLSENGIASDGASTGESNTVTGTIKRMAQAVIEGNSHFYITLEPETQKITGPDQGNITQGQTLIFDASITSFPEIIGFNEGDTLTMEFKLGQPVCQVVTLEGQEAADAEESQTPEEEQPTDTEE